MPPVGSALSGYRRPCGPSHCHSESRCRAGRVAGESAAPEFSDRERRGVVERARRDLDGMLACGAWAFV